MNYSIGDKVEVKPKDKVRVIVNGVLAEPVWQLWLTEIFPAKSIIPKFYQIKPCTNDQVWVAKFTRASHSTLIQESWITRKISSNFKDFYPVKKNEQKGEN